MTAAEILPLIKPRNIRESDKYSANLYQHVRKFKRVAVLRHKPTGEYYLVHSNWRDDDWKCITGAPVLAIMAGRKLGSTRDPYSGVWLGRNYADCDDVTGTFWRNYIRMGRCVFDPEHRLWFLGDEGRFSLVASARRCNWCGAWFRKEVKKVVRIERVVTWEPVKKVLAETGEPSYTGLTKIKEQE